jgi:hypothetical protein
MLKLLYYCVFTERTFISGCTLLINLLDSNSLAGLEN